MSRNATKILGIAIAAAAAFLVLYEFAWKSPAAEQPGHLSGTNPDNGSGASAEFHPIQIEAEAFAELDREIGEGPIRTTLDINNPEITALEIPEFAGKPGDGTHPDDWGWAKYVFEVPVEGDYVLKARCYWNDQCGNSFNLRVNDEQPVIQVLGKKYKQWRTERIGKRIHLTKGTNTLTLINNEDGIKVDYFRIEKPVE